MSRFSITLFGDTIHKECFREVACALRDALRLLGHEVVPWYDPNPGRDILLGANNVRDTLGKMKPDAIIFNTEQLAAVGQVQAFMQNAEQYKSHVIWDYSSANCKLLRESGFKKVVECPIGYMPGMSYIQPAKEEDIDVLFYGSVNERRKEILDALSAVGLKVVSLFGVYGDERDKAIARAKVVLNLHYYENAIFEIFRVSHLVANKKCVVTEDGGSDAKLEALAKNICVYVARDKIVEACQAMVTNAEVRKARAEQTFEEFKKVDFVESVKKATEASGVSSSSPYQVVGTRWSQVR